MIVYTISNTCMLYKIYYNLVAIPADGHPLQVAYSSSKDTRISLTCCHFVHYKVQVTTVNMNFSRCQYRNGTTSYHQALSYANFSNVFNKVESGRQYFTTNAVNLDIFENFLCIYFLFIYCL